ncbi:MAG: NRDE family protein [Gemmatimonadota bacterium]
MCTVSWLPDRLGYTLCFNRDERLTRAPALPPAVRDGGAVQYIAPLDGNFGGTWLASNAFGLSLGILNRYRVPGYVAPPSPRSRGLLPLQLIAHPTAAEAVAGLGTTDLGATQPFVLIAVEPGGPVRLAGWDGSTLEVTSHARAGLIMTSSSVTEPEVAASRQALFGALHEISVQQLESLHRSHLPERGRCSVCMHREDAETQSFSEIRVTAHQVSWLHTPDAPCRGAALPAITLARRALHCPSPS